MAEAKSTKATQKAEMSKKRKHCPVQDIDLFSYDNQIELTFSHSTKAAKAPIFDLDSSDDDDDCVEDYEEFKRTNDYEDDEDDLLDDSLEIQNTDSEESMAEKSIDRRYRRSPSPSPPPPSQAELLRVQQQLRARKGARDFENAFSSLKQAVADNFLSPISQTRQSTSVIQLDDTGSPFNVKDSAERIRNIKVRTTFGIKKFNIKAGDKFEVIIKELAKLQGVAVDNILLSLNNVNILPEDTPLSKGVTVADIVECVTMESCADVDEDNLIEIKIQGGDAASKKTFKVNKNKPLEQLFKEYAKYRKLPRSKLKFLFDGDALTGDETPEQLDMEDESVIDVTSRK